MCFVSRFIGTLLQSGDGGWIGLNDRDFESRFIWNDGNIGAVKYTAWAEGEPNNLNFECNIENCVVMIRSSGKWADTICNGIYPYVCEIPFKNSKYNTIIRCCLRALFSVLILSKNFFTACKYAAKLSIV